MRRPASAGRVTICFDIWSPVPVFHEWSHYDTGRHAAITHCGRPIDPDSWRVVRMRRDHAQRIGRACARCASKGMAWTPRFTTTHQQWSPA